jgi:hypothetical protein
LALVLTLALTLTLALVLTLALAAPAGFRRGRTHFNLNVPAMGTDRHLQSLAFGGNVNFQKGVRRVNPDAHDAVGRRGAYGYLGWQVSGTHEKTILKYRSLKPLKSSSFRIFFL